MAVTSTESAESIARELTAFVERDVVRLGGKTEALEPSQRVKFDWPPHPVSYSYHVLASDWKQGAALEIDGESFPVEIAATPYGVFGRCNDLWLESRGQSADEMLANLRLSAEPLFLRQRTINACLEREGRFADHVRDLQPLDLLKLLYCSDRDISNDARIEIETHASSHVFAPALTAILRDQRHPYRRSAQWCVLDLFEDLPSFCSSPEQEEDAVRAMKELIWSAQDDFGRIIYKAGVVLGGHIPHKHGGPVLLECLAAPSRIGRRSAIHGLFHVVEWLPAMRDQVVAGLEQVADSDPDPQLREYAEFMARDIENNEYEHVPEPVFAGE